MRTYFSAFHWPALRLPVALSCALRGSDAVAERLLGGFAIVLLLVAVVSPALLQGPQHHHFADQRFLWGLPYAMDVLSNLPFVIAGAWGWLALRALAPWARTVGSAPSRQMAAVFFAGLVVTALSSAAYHLRPDDLGLLWDRLGMALVFAGLLALAVAERISVRAGRVALAVLLVAGPLAVAVWFATGNVLPWVLVQFGGMAVVLCLAWRPADAGTLAVRWGTVIAVYAVAKLLEAGDHLVFDATAGWVSGHSLKHGVAACAAWPVVAALQQHVRRLVPGASGAEHNRAQTPACPPAGPVL